MSTNPCCRAILTRCRAYCSLLALQVGHNLSLATTDVRRPPPSVEEVPPESLQRLPTSTASTVRPMACIRRWSQGDDDLVPVESFQPFQTIAVEQQVHLPVWGYCSPVAGATSLPFSRANRRLPGKSRFLPAPIKTCVNSLNATKSTRGATMVIFAHVNGSSIQLATNRKTPPGSRTYGHELSPFCSSCNVVNQDLASKSRMPRIVDFQLLPYMGRMNGQSSSVRGSSSASSFPRGRSRLAASRSIESRRTVKKATKRTEHGDPWISF